MRSTKILILVPDFNFDFECAVLLGHDVYAQFVKLLLSGLLFTFWT